MRGKRGAVRHLCAVFLFTIAAGGSPAGQGLPAAAQRTFGELKARVGRAADSEGQRLQIHWFTELRPEANGRNATPAAVLMQRLRGVGALQYERDPQLSTDSLVVISADAAGRELDWRLVRDPRLVRGETADAAGRISGQPFRRVEADLLVDIPDNPAIVAVRIYEVQWVEREFVLSLVTTVNLQ